MLEKILKEKKLLLVCGSGGVGKTTLSASLALKAAILGKKVIVLTIDPAKRLATSLGLEELTSEPKRIDPKKIKGLAQIENLELYAMMLDTKRTFDQLVIKYAPSKEAQEKILNNKIYHHLSNMIAGSQEYMAMEKLYEFSKENAYDLIVIDTPPTTHAIDFLHAPQKMIDALSHSMIHILLKPAILMGKGGFKIFDKGSKFILKIFDRITGFAFLQDISEMLLAFQSLLGGFQNRAGEVKEILTAPQTAFALVATGEKKSIQESQFFVKTLDELKLPLSGVILNRIHPYYPIKPDQQEEDLKTLNSLVGTQTSQKMIEDFNNFQIVAKRELKLKKEITEHLEKGIPIATIPLFESDIHDLKGLYELGKYL